MVRLIINADDFGASELTNKGIFDSMRHGIVRSTTILANGNAFGHAASLAKKHKLDAGVHLNLTNGRTLTGAKGLGGKAFEKKNLRRAMLRTLDRAEIEAELGKQIGRVVEAGLKPTHLDGHKHIHVMPTVVDAVISLAKTYGIMKVRLPYTRKIGLKKMFTKAGMNAIILNHYAKAARRKFEKAGMETTDSFYGMMETGLITLENLKRIIADIDTETAELMCHPGYYDKSLDSRLKESRETELRALTDEEAEKAIMEKGIKLIGYGEL